MVSAYGKTEHFAVANQYDQPCNTLLPPCIVQFNTQQRGVSFSVKISKKSIGLAGGAQAAITKQSLDISLVLSACTLGESLASVWLH